jgi:hypothetical protein
MSKRKPDSSELHPSELEFDDEPRSKKQKKSKKKKKKKDESHAHEPSAHLSPGLYDGGLLQEEDEEEEEYNYMGEQLDAAVQPDIAADAVASIDMTVASYTAVPLHDDDSPPSEDSAAYCFLCNEHADHTSDNVSVQVLLDLTARYSKQGRWQLAATIERHYNEEIRPYVTHNPEWSQRAILLHMEEHAPTESVWLVRDSRTLTRTIDLLQSNGLVVQDDATGVKSLAGPAILNTLMKLIKARYVYNKRLHDIENANTMI